MFRQLGRQGATQSQAALPAFFGSTQHPARRFFEILIDPKAMSRQEDKKKKKQHRTSRKPSYRLVDRANVRVSGGPGGKGSLSMHQLRRKYKLRPDGGHGGNGGSVILIADPNEQSLRWSHPHIQAEKGTNGSSQDRAGRNGENLIVRVPCGVVVRRVLDHDETWDETTQRVIRPPRPSESGGWEEVDMEAMGDGSDDDDDGIDSDDEYEVEESDNGKSPYAFGGFTFDDDEFENIPREDRQKVVLTDLDEPGSNIMVARGGRGGLGSSVYASHHGALPEARVLIQNAKPEAGEVAFLELELKLIADIGLVGFPNAGKSSLLRAMSRATPEVAPYPFTTLHPLLGCIDYRDGYRVRVADIPGLVDGAAEGRGKGHDFLKHVERTKSLLYIVDAAGVDFRDPVKDLHILAHEIASYGDGSMLERRALVVANKMDLIPQDVRTEVLSLLSEGAEDLGLHLDHPILPISAGVTGEGLADLSRAMRDVVTRTEEDRGTNSEALG